MSKCYFSQIHLAEKAIPSLHLKVEQKDMGLICWQVLLASNRCDYMMITMCSFWNVGIKHRVISQNGNFWWIETCPQHKVQIISQQFLQTVFSIMQLFNVIGVYVCLFPLFFTVIKILFTGFLQLAKLVHFQDRGAKKYFWGHP